MNWATITIFIMGIANFALNRAVFASGHPLLARLPLSSRTWGQRAALGSEFALLFFALLLSVKGWPVLAFAYAAYTLFNGLAAWLILTRRV